MSFNTSIPCPDCQTNIAMDSQQLLLGVQFSCPSCGVKIGLSPESHSSVKEIMEKLEKLKTQIHKKPE